MRTELFDYVLPETRIATRPLEFRDGGKLCVVEEAGPKDRLVREFPDFLDEKDLVVLNETRVRRARLFCRRPRLADGGGGGRVELLFLHPVSLGVWAALGRAAGPLRPGDELSFDEVVFRIEDKSDDGTLLVAVQGDLEQALERGGQMPIPPYFRREADADDVERYQTVFAKTLGSAAAPTAGLHLTDELFARMVARGTKLARLTLHVGIGTFRPVSSDDLDEHPMHEESYEITSDLLKLVNETRTAGGRVVAIGTTVVRALESASTSGSLEVGPGRTRLLIQPGYEFRTVDALWTNFHMPKSTLLALVAAFGGRERILNAYQHALAHDYRFLSYGDAMWIPRRLP